MPEEQNQPIEDSSEEKVIKKSPSTSSGQEKKSIFKKILIGLILLVLVVVAVQFALCDNYQATVLAIEDKEAPKKVGVNPTTSKLDFGDLSRDTAATRYITLTSSGSLDTYVWVIKRGKIAEIMDISDDRFVLEAGEERRLDFDVYMPPSAPIGERLDGSVWIFKMPKIW